MRPGSTGGGQSKSSRSKDRLRREHHRRDHRRVVVSLAQRFQLSVPGMRMTRAMSHTLSEPTARWIRRSVGDERRRAHSSSVRSTRLGQRPVGVQVSRATTRQMSAGALGSAVKIRCRRRRCRTTARSRARSRRLCRSSCRARPCRSRRRSRSVSSSVHDTTAVGIVYDLLGREELLGVGKPSRPYRDSTKPSPPRATSARSHAGASQMRDAAHQRSSPIVATRTAVLVDGRAGAGELALRLGPARRSQSTCPPGGRCASCSARSRARRPCRGT